MHTVKGALVVVALLGACQDGVPAAGGGASAPRPVEPTPTPIGASARVVKPTVMPEVPPTSAPVTPMLIAADLAPPPTEVAPPFSLTASDGSGLLLTRIDAKAVVQGPLAFTELHLYFHNPEQRTREGTFAITLPRGAAVSRFAMEIDGKFQEAEVIEKAVARRVYDDFLHRKQDPALLEKGAGNQFTAKVFPIFAGADKHLVISFSQDLPGQRYALPLRGLPKVARVDASLSATRLDGSAHVQTLAEQNWQPDRDFVTDVPASATAVVAGGLVVAAVTVGDTEAQQQATDAPTRLTILVDTSASRALGFARYVGNIRELVTGLATRYGGGVSVRVVAFDQDTETIYEGPAMAYGDLQDRALLARGAAGASDVGQALAVLASTKLLDHGAQRLVVVTDGVMTAGGELPAVVAQAQALAPTRVDVVLAGGIRDEGTATALVRSGTTAGDVLDLDRGAGAVVAALGEPVLVDIPVQVAGAEWIYPRTLSAARVGSPVLVVARLTKPSQAIAIAVGGPVHTIGLGQATPALVERAVASAEIADLEAQLVSATADDAAKLLRADIAKRSIASRVISSQTSMLVLETEEDYARYKIERTALTDILTIGPAGLEQTKRTQIAAAPKRNPQPARDRVRPDTVAVNDPMRTTGDAAPRDVSSGLDDANLHGVLGTAAGEMEGGFGYGREGFGPGGGGTGWGTIGTGRYGTIGSGSGTGSGYGVGSGRGGMRGRTSAVPTVTIGRSAAEGGLDPAIVRRYIKRNINKIQYCYERELVARPGIQGALTVQFLITAQGAVQTASATSFDATVGSCITDVVKAIVFPNNQAGGVTTVTMPFTFRPTGDAGPTTTSAWDGYDADSKVAALTGKLATVMKHLDGGKIDAAAELATAWHAEQPGDVLALIALGEVLEAKGETARAARMYGSIIDLFATRADFRRFAGERLSRLGEATEALVIDTYRRAVADRPDHVTGHRLLAFALERSGDHAGAFAAILAGIDQAYPDGRFRGADRLLREDAGIIGAAYAAAGGPRDTIVADLKKRDTTLATRQSTRFILYWETDSNDVDFHIRDSQGGHAWYSQMQLASGGELYADVTTGYGPECFAIHGKPTAGPYALSINYYSQGPMGYGMGLLQVQHFDGSKIAYEDRPYVIMVNRAFVDLGIYQPGSLAAKAKAKGKANDTTKPAGWGTVPNNYYGR